MSATARRSLIQRFLMNANNALTDDNSGRNRANLNSFLKANFWHNSSEDISVWALLDGQWVPDLLPRLAATKLTFCSLYNGLATQERLASSPYLVKLEPEDDFTDWICDSGWGAGWGIVLRVSSQRAEAMYRKVGDQSALKVQEKTAMFVSENLKHEDNALALKIRRHLRYFTRVKFASDGRIVAFRFFDPHVLDIWLRAANDQEIQTFFGPVLAFFSDGYAGVGDRAAGEQLRVYSLSEGSEGQFLGLNAVSYDRRVGTIGQLAGFSSSHETSVGVGAKKVMEIRVAVEREFDRDDLEVVYRNVEDSINRKFPDLDRDKVASGIDFCKISGVEKTANIAFIVSLLANGSSFLNEGKVRRYMSAQSHYSADQRIILLRSMLPREV
ncbi:DUF4123 domain-containing protein [Agrobacterium vitis]|nr:DUF4123 domain-containing protein [Allorhizobium ampelinum]MVA72108.1 DUF4123 domain-containing protein [Agrobacterium vitis]